MIMRKILILLLMTLGFCRMQAQTDPTLAGMIVIYTEKAKSELKSQEKAMALQTTGHIWIKEEVDATSEYQRLYNDYLDTFRDIICYAAQIYGFYYEIGKLTDNMGSLTMQLKANPGGAVAAALLPNRSAIYREILIGSLDIVNDIRQVCLSNIKMTEKQRAEIVFAIRPKLKTINKKLQHLTLAVKYSSMSDVWNEIDEGTIEKADNAKIAKAAKLRWKLRARKVK
jgi:hypothetical protein